MTDLTTEEINILLALADAGVKAAGNELYRLKGGAIYQSAYDKLQGALAELAKPKPAPEPEKPAE